MENARLKVLLIEDDEIDRMAFLRYVPQNDIPYDCVIAKSIAEARLILNSDRFDVIISDYNLGDGQAFDILDMKVDAPVIVTTGMGNEDIAVRALKSGAYDYLIKDRERNYLKVIPTTIEKALRRKEIEDQLHIAQFSLDNSADLVLWATPDGKLTYANDETCWSLGYTREELLSLNLRDVIFATSSKETKRMAKALREKRSLRLEPWLNRKDGSTFPVEIQMNYEEFNEREYVFVFARDITERKRAEEGLRYGEEKLRAMFDAIGDGVGVTDLEATMVEVNEAFLRVFGMGDKKEAIGLCASVFIAEKDHPKLLEHVGNVLESGHSETREYTLLDNAGQEFEGETTAALMRDGSGNPVGFVSATRDITERKRAEEELKVTHQRLIETARKAGMAEVATGVLHNVGNVVNSAGITTSSIQETIRTSRMANLSKVAALLEEHQDQLEAFLTTDERGQKLLTYISALAEHLIDERDKLNKNLNTLSEHMQHIIEIVNLQQSYSTTAGVTELVNPADIMEDALRINDSALTRHSVKVVKEYEDLSPVSLDRHKTLQVLTNLMNNAKHALTQNDGASKVLTLCVKTGDDGRIIFEVADNGIGIAEEDITRIFSYGFTTKKDGHGFGLHNGALAAREMGGYLRAYSDGRGKGATFALELPFNQKEE